MESLGTTVYPFFSNKTASIKAIAFDAYTLFDTSSVTRVLEEIYPQKSKDIMNIWRTRQFEYTWLRSLTKHYENFEKVTADALVYATAFLRLPLSEQHKHDILEEFRSMKFLPEVKTTLQLLKSKSLRLAILSNVTQKILENSVKRSECEGLFEFILSTDIIKDYKPAPKAYQLGVNAFRLRKDEILFVAFGGWDEAGAKLFGYPTVWINANDLPVEQLDVRPDFICKRFSDLENIINNF